MDIECIFCHSAIRIGNKGYILHLYQYHRIKFDIDHVINRTRDSLQVQKAKIYYSTMNSTVNEIVNDILEKVIGNPKTCPQFLKPVNESIEDINANKFDSPHVDLSYLVSDKYGDNIDNPIDESCDDFDESDISDDYSESDISDTSFLSLAEDENQGQTFTGQSDLTKKSPPVNDHPLDDICDNFIDIINDDFNTHAVCDNLGESDISDTTLLKDVIDASPNKDYKFDHLHDGSCDYSKKLDISDTSLLIKVKLESPNKDCNDYSELTKNPPKESDMPAALKEMNFNCYVKVEDVKKKSDKILQMKLKEKRKHATAFSEELNMTGRRKSARLEVKTIQSSEGSQEKSKVMAEKSKVTEEKSKVREEKSNVTTENSKVIAENSKVIGEKSIVVAEKSKGMVEKSKVVAEKNKVTAEKSKVIADTDEIKREDAEIKIENADTDHILAVDVEKMQNTAMSNSKIIPWYHGTIYSCQLCTKQFVQKRNFKIHMEGEHSVSCEEYEEKSRHSNTHECELCGKGFSWYRNSIEGHLTKQHNISLTNYYEQFKDDIVLPNLHITDETLLSRFALNSNPDLEWANQCTFKCALCNQEFNSKSKFGTHLRSYHQLSLREYTKDHGVSMSNERKHSCQVENCNSYIWWDRETIRSHLTGVHDKMSVEEYETTYMNNYAEKTVDSSSSGENSDSEWANQCTFQCALCFKEFNSKSKFGTHLKSNHQLSIKEYTKDYGKSILHEEKHYCQIESCDTVIIWDKSSILRHIKNVHDLSSIEDYKEKYMDDYVEKANTSNAEESIDTDNEWSNKCTFTCALCKAEFNSHSRFGTHLKRRHEIAVKEYSKDHGTSITHEEKHSCQVENCNANLWWDRMKILKHLYGSHEKMSIDTYEKKYMSNYEHKSRTLLSNDKPGISNSNKPGRDNSNESWANRCIYKCNICEETFKVKEIFRIHIKTQHNISSLDYANTYGRTMAHEEKHTCQVEECGSHFWWTGHSFTAHFKLKHGNMNIEEYENQYMANYKGKPNNSDQPKQKQKKSDQPSNNIKASLWANRCIFKCGVCGYEAAPRRKLEIHLKVAHKMTIEDHTKQFGRIMSHEEKHSCQVENCTSFLFWDKRYIYKHLHSKHDKMSLEQYKERYMPNYEEKGTVPNSKLKTTTPGQTNNNYSECEFSCNICKSGKVFYSKVKAGVHMKAIHGINLKQYKDKHGSSVTFKINHTCQICAASLLWDKSAIKNHIYKAHNKMSISEYFEKFIDNFEDDTEWLNKITLKCKECDNKQTFSTKNRAALWKHVEKAHKKTETEYKSVHGSIYSPALPESHSCQICFEKINWESISLKPHIEIKHNMTVQEYVAKFKESYKKKQGNATQKITNKTSSNVQKTADMEVEDEEVLKWTTGSLHLCKICDKGVAGQYQFKKHLESRHNTDYKQYEKMHQIKDFLLFEGFHICTICQKNIRHDQIYLHNHMKEHDLTIREYMDKYKPKPPKLYRMMKDRQATSNK